MKRRILLVDDDFTVITVVRQLLEYVGFGVSPFTDSRDALAAFRKSPRDFDLVITDLKMPNLDGVHLSRALLNTRPDIPIILCTGYCEGFTAEQAREIGIREFMTKPLSLIEIVPAIERAVNRAAGPGDAHPRKS